ncbi:MAG: hypothetical protein LBP21_11665 [Synergistaceae bacterium]|nr:hypothetical protein [Synergistaceae bacterium]
MSIDALDKLNPRSENPGGSRGATNPEEVNEPRPLESENLGGLGGASEDPAGAERALPP